ncbi:MAG: molecular chaperone DnaK [Proteobacteria bacterium]|nr:MAG: molecular chaperone DnaK [Pseudomonadota bacterium]
MSEEAVVGIDLGTSNTVVAVVQGSKATVIPDQDGRRIHPSVVSFHPNGTVLVGQDAKRRRVIDPQNTVYSSKRLIGRPARAEQVKAMMERAPYEVIEGENQQSVVMARGNEYTVPEISAFILRHVRALAEAHIGQEVEKAVITVPANFNDAQREATRAAGRIAGLQVLRILNEPTAAALAYGYGRGMTNRIVIYDFGGGTFDITILQLNDRVFEVLSTAGDTFLGGDDIDEQIVDYMIEIFLRNHHVDLTYNTSAMARLRSVAEQIKCQLSSRPKAVVQVQEIAYGAGGQPLDLNFTLTVEALDAMARELVQRSFLICDEAVSLAALSPTQIDDVVMVGGSTRMPLVREAAKGYFGIDPRTDINPDEVVAVGAAIQAAALVRSGAAVGPSGGGGGGAIDSVLLDVTPRALGIGVVGGYAETIIYRNAQIPVEQTRKFTTSQDNQQVVRIQVCQGESRIFEENEPLGELVFDDLRQAPRGKVEVEVTFEIDTNGILQVSAIDTDTGRRQRAHVELVGSVDEGKIEQMQRRQEQMPTAVPESR